jgi:hypothetical protein
MPWPIKEPDIEDLTHEAIKLLSLEIDELYTVLGCQLLGSAPPTRGANIVTNVVHLRKARPAEKINNITGSAIDTDKWLDDVEDLWSGLKGDGVRFVDAMKDEFRKGLCNENVFNLTDDVDESKMQILIMIISAILKTPPQFESISATLAAMLCKSMLRDICR